MDIATFIIINFLLFGSWYLFFYSHKESLSFVDRIIAAFILALTQIIATEMLLGIVFKNLYAGPLLISNIIVSSGVLAYSHVVGRKKMLDIGSLLIEIRDETGNLVKIFREDWTLCCLLGLFSISLSWIIFTGYLFPSYTWDALWYHLPIIGHIMQSGAIEQVPVNSFIEQFINIFPKNIELFFLWNIIFIKNDVIADLSQLPFIAIWMFTVYSLAIKLNIQKKHAVFASFLLFFSPLIILQLTTNYIDVAMGALLLIAVNFLMNTNSEEALHMKKRNFSLFLAGIAAGILLGSKGSGPLYIAVLSAAVIIQEYIILKNMPSFLSRALKSLVHYSSYFLLPVILIGGYWYINNWVLYGNPVYPMEISFLNITIFKGLFKGIVEPPPDIINKLNYFTRPLYVWAENIKYYLYDSRLGGFGPIWFILFLPGMLFSFFYSIAQKKYNYIIVTVIIAIIFLIFPRNWTPRYVIFILGLGALSFAVTLDYFRNRANVLKIVALVLAGYTVITSNSPCIMPEKVREFMRLPVSERTIGWLAPFNIDIHARQEYGHWIWISRNVFAGDTLAYTFEPLFHLPLWNGEYSNKIVYIKSDEYKDWLNMLQENEADYILIKTNAQEDKWIEKEIKVFYSLGWIGNVTEKFKVVYSDDTYKIIKFIKNKKERANG